MICPTCSGDGFVKYPYPCNECGGSGRAPCCDGASNDAPSQVHPALRDHVASPECWCRPTRDTVEPTLYIHNLGARAPGKLM